MLRGDAEVKLASPVPAGQDYADVLMRKLLSWVTFNLRGRCPAGLRFLAALAGGLFWMAPAPLEAATFTATLDRETVTVGESATLTLSFEGGEPKAIPAVPALPNLRVTGEGSSRNISMVNGRVTASISQNLSL